VIIEQTATGTTRNLGESPTRVHSAL